MNHTLIFRLFCFRPLFLPPLLSFGGRGFLFLFLFLSVFLNAQSFRIRDHYGNIANNDTLMVIFHPNGNHGWTELTLELYVQNTSNATKTLSVKKTEYAMDPDEYHAICFGGTCFDSSTFISPFKDPVAAGGIDSTFSGHYRFDDLGHKGRRIVAYTFYDENQPGDSSIVYVEYNTMQKEGIGKTSELSGYSIMPNPTTGLVRFTYSGLNTAINEEYTFRVFNALGACVMRGKLIGNVGLEELNLEGFGSGIYYFAVFKGTVLQTREKVVLN